MPFLQMQLEAERKVRALRRQIKPYKEIDMSEQIKKSPYTKTIESYSKLNLQDQISAFEMIRGILEQSLNTEKASLSQKRTDVEEMLELIKK